MKLLHLGDLHIGKYLGDFDLIEDQKYILEQIVSIAKEQQADAVLIAGDVYDKSVPSEAAVNLLDSFLNTMVANEIKVFMISGNHDSDERLNFGSSVFEAKGIYICSKYDGKLYKRTFQDEFGKINIFLMPFIKASQVKYYYPEEDISSYDDAVRVVLKYADIDVSERNILVAHQFVTGSVEDPQLAGSENASVKNVGLVEKIGWDCFDQFDYVALGHIHSAQKVGREEVRYSGSPLKYSLSEVNNKKSVPIVLCEGKEDTKIVLKELIPMRDLRHIKGKMENLLRADCIADAQDYMYITLTDEDMVNDAMNIFQGYYPNTVRIDYENSHTREIEDFDIADMEETRSFSELISGFYEQMYACAISEEEMQVMKEIAREAGVADEAD